MSKAVFTKEKDTDIYLSCTPVENLVINELMPAAPGEYVKVYLFGLMRAEQGLVTSADKIAAVLGMDEAQVDKAWSYWEQAGAVRREVDEDEDIRYRVTFLSQINRLYGLHRRESAATPAPVDSRLLDQELKALYDRYERTAGRTISSHEMRRIAETLNVYQVTPDVLAYAMKYCAEIDKTSMDYIAKVAIRWKGAGCNDIAQVKELLDRESRRSAGYTRVFREMGFQRSWTPGDRAMMDRWFDELGFSLDEVLQACRLTAGMREPSLRYVNRVLENKYREAGGVRPDRRFREAAALKATAGGGASEGDAGDPLQNVSRKVLEAYYEHLRQEAEEARRRRQAEIEERVPVMRRVATLEQEMNRRAVSFDFSTEAKADRARLRTKREQLAEEKKRILQENGYAPDYLELPYRCKACKDTGMTEDGRRCPCAKLRAAEAYAWNKARTAETE